MTRSPRSGSPRGRRRWPQVAAALASTVVLAACGGSGGSDASAAPVDPATAELYTAAQQEAPLTLYSSQNPELIESTVAAFNEQYPDVTVETSRLASGALATRYAAERDAGVCTAGAVIIGDPVFLEQGVERGWFATVGPDQVPELPEWPDEYYSFDAVARISLIPAAITTNTTKIPEADAPATVQDLLDPALRGQIVLVDPRSTPGWMALMNLLRQEYGDDFLRGLAAQQVAFADSSVPATQQVAAGERAVVFPTITSVADPLVEQGAPLTTNVITEGVTTGIEQFVAISECAASPNAARLFMNFLLTPEGQAAVNGSVAASPREGVAGTLPLPEGYTDPAIGELTPEIEQQILRLLGLQ